MTAPPALAAERAPTPRRVSWAGLLLLGYLLLVTVVITLAPFRFSWPRAVRLSWIVDPLDIAANILLFVPLGFLGRLSAGSPATRSLAATGVAAIAVSAALETLQVMLPGRYPSAVDVATNGLGGWLGALLHRRMEQGLSARLVTRLALELPLVNLVYLLVPLLWLAGLAAGRDPARLWLVPLLALFGGGVLTAVWRHRLAAARTLSANGIAAAAGAWLLAAVFPSLAVAPVFVLACALGLAAAVRLQTARPLDDGEDRRFELPTLRRLWPLYAAYLLALALWPWPWSPGRWHAGLGLIALADMPGMAPMLRLLEYLAAFTLGGYMLAEARGRRGGDAGRVDAWGIGACIAGAALLEGLRGFHPAHGASLLQLALAAGMGLYGGLAYRLQLTVVRRLLGAER